MALRLEMIWKTVCENRNVLTLGKKLIKQWTTKTHTVCATHTHPVLAGRRCRMRRPRAPQCPSCSTAYTPPAAGDARPHPQHS